jgi:hypothetical protein
VHYSWRVEKNYQHGLDAGSLEFQFLRPRGSVALFRGHGQNTRSHLP